MTNSPISPTLPWTPEYSLSTEQLQHILIENQILEVEEIRYLGEGWDFFNFVVNETWVFRIPKRHEDADTLNRERNLLNKLQLSIRHPVFEYWIPKPRGFHLPIAGYRYIEGTPLSHFDPSDVDLSKLAVDLGEFLRSLHGELITKPQPNRDSLSYWFETFEETLSTCQPYLSKSIVELCQHLFASFQPNELPKTQVTCHNDLHPEHILLDSKHELTAVIDWADMSSCPPFVDFAGAWLWGGERFFHDVCDTYGTFPTAQELNMVRFLGVTGTLNGIKFGHLEKDIETIDACVHEVTRRLEFDHFGESE